jgi:phosphate transport system protein
VALLGFRRQLTAFDDEVVALFTVVTVSVSRASAAFLTGDTTETARLLEGAQLSSIVLDRVEHEVEVAVACHAPVASDLRFLLTLLRVVPELKRCIELAAHIAKRASFAADLPIETMALFESMGTVTSRMWEAASTAWSRGDPFVASALDEDDDELDVLANELTAILSAATLDPATAMESRLVIRFYERLGDHAVHLCERIRWRAAGDSVLPSRPNQAR